MHYTIKIIGYDGQAKAIVECDGLRSDVCRMIADHPGAERAEVTDGLGRVEVIGKGAAFVAVDGRPRSKEPFCKLKPSLKPRAVRAPRAWYGAAIVG